MALADLSAIGFWGFAAATFAAGTVDCGWYTNDNRGLFAAFLMFGGLAQLVAGLWDGLRGNAAGGVILAGFGFYWTGEAIAMFPNLNGIAQAKYDDIHDYNKLVGFYKLCWAAFAIPMVYVMFRASLLQGITLLLVAVIFFLHALEGLLSTYERVSDISKAAGYLMLVAAVLAYYMGCGLYLKASGAGSLPFGAPLFGGGAKSEESLTHRVTDGERRNVIEVVEP